MRTRVRQLMPGKHGVIDKIVAKHSKIMAEYGGVILQHPPVCVSR